MAWIKMEVCLPDKPEVWQIANELSLDPDAVIGKLLRIWAWFDAHTTDGNAHVTVASLLDRISGVSGFASAMCNCGWLIERDGMLIVPNFDRHNGESAKQRALTANRVAKHRAKCNATAVTSSVTSPLPEKRREEKRREEEIHTPSTAREAFRQQADDVDVEGNGHPKKPKTAQTYSAAFEAWWKVYPKRAGKRDANKAWIAAGKRLKIERDTDSEGAAAFMLERAEAFAKAIQGTDDQFIPHPATWLNAAKYDDDPAIWKPRKASDNGQQLRLPHSCDDGIKHPGTVNW